MKFATLPIAIALVLSSTSSLALTKIKGTVESVDLERNSFSIVEKKTGVIHDIAFKAHSKIRKERRSYSDLAVLQIGDKVVYKKKSIKKTHRRLSPISVTVKSVDVNNSLITFINNKTQALQTLRFEAARSSAFASLTTGDKVILELEKTVEPKLSAL